MYSKENQKKKKNFLKFYNYIINTFKQNKYKKKTRFNSLYGNNNNNNNNRNRNNNK